ncbi:MAG: hypothetical protein QGG64_03100 [Candidatus Latescibacteria bacterium]|nr:hypothetical protein [Candidatus Latescibacterota bacterium]
MAHLQIDNAETFYRTFADLIADGEDDKHIARKLGCSRGEVKRQRQAFQKLSITTDKGVSKKELDAWLASIEGQRTQRQWEGQHKKQQAMGATNTKQQKGFTRQTDVKRGWSRQKV